MAVSLPNPFRARLPPGGFGYDTGITIKPDHLPSVTRSVPGPADLFGVNAAAGKVGCDQLTVGGSEVVDAVGPVLTDVDLPVG